MSDHDSIQPPERSKGDLAHSVVKATLGSIPLAGAAASELFALMIGPPIEKRRDEWMRDVGERLKRLEGERGVNLEDLQKDEGFIDTMMQASHIAMRHTQKEKREALRNAITNSALPNALEDAERQMFLGLIDQFTVWHLRILALFNDLVNWFEGQDKERPSLYSGALSNILEAAYPELDGKRGFYDQVWRDLFAAGLTTTEGLHMMMTGSVLWQTRTSERGKAFLRLISDTREEQ